MENWDDDFSTLKAKPRAERQRPLSAWKADIPLGVNSNGARQPTSNASDTFEDDFLNGDFGDDDFGDGERTLTKRQAPRRHDHFGTVTAGSKPSLKPPSKTSKAPPPPVTFDFDDGDDDFAAAFEQAAQLRRQSNVALKPVVPPQTNAASAFTRGHRPQLSDLDTFSDASARSPDRASSVSSAASLASNATSWSQPDDELGDGDFDYDEAFAKPAMPSNNQTNGPGSGSAGSGQPSAQPSGTDDLMQRFRRRQERARQEAEAEAAQLAANYAKTVRRRAARRQDDDFGDLAFDELPTKVKSGTVNRHVKLAPPSKMLRGMRSIAQLPQQRLDVPDTKLRAAVSMLDLRRRTPLGSGASGTSTPSHPSIPTSTHTSTHTGTHTSIPNGLNFATMNSFGGSSGLGLSAGPSLHTSSSFAGFGDVRPLTSYKDPTKTISGRKHRRKPNLIRHPQQLTRQAVNGMTLNPDTGLWDGNEIEDSRFEFEAKPRLITQQSVAPPPAAETGMLFDNRTLSWVYANEADYEDPFQGIDDADFEAPSGRPTTAGTANTANAFGTASFGAMSAGSTPTPPGSVRRVTNESTASSGAFAGARGSVMRAESSGAEVFAVPRAQAAEWRHIDERFVRKFGKWIGGDEERADGLLSDLQFYEMVRNI